MKSNLSVFSGMDFRPGTYRKILALILSTELILSFSSLGFFYVDTMLPISLAYVNIAIVIAAMILGPGAGALSGIVYGLCRMWRTDTAPVSELGRLFAPQYSGDPAASVILSTVPHIFAGIVIGLAFHAMFRHLPKKLLPWAIGIFACVGIYIHRFFMYFTMWWVFPGSGLTVRQTVYPTFNLPLIVNWLLGAALAVWLYTLLSDSRILDQIKAHEEISSDLETHFRRTIIYTSLSFLIIAVAIFAYISGRHEVILHLAGIPHSPTLLNSFHALVLQTMVVLGAVMFIIEMIMIWQHENHILDQKRHESTLNEISEKHQKDQLNLVTTMSSIYCETYYINFPDEKSSTYTFTALKQDQKLRDVIPSGGDCSEFVIDGIINHVIDPVSQSDVYAFLDISTMGDRLARSGGSMSMDFIHKVHGWCSANLIVAEKNESGEIRRVLLAIRLLDEKKRQEMEMHDALTSALDNITNANAAKSDFLLRMSHDLRTPMNDILGMTTIAGTQLDDKDRVADCLKKINRSGKQLLLLLNEILDITRFESGNLELVSEDFSLSDLTENLVKVATAGTEKKHQHLELKINSFHHELLIGDSRRIQRIFTSLVDNAIRYTPEGGTITITGEEKNSNRLDIASFEFTFEDTGYGIKEEDLRHIFEPFYRPKDDRIARFQGSGLGLPISKSIARLMSGDIRAESTYGKGSCFTVTFTLPIQKQDDIPIPPQLKGLHVLAISDQPLSCDTLCQLLTELGMNAEWIISEAAAINRAVEAHEAGNGFDAVIFDWDSPAINQLEIIAALRRRLKNDAPVFIAASSDTALVEHEAKEAGASFIVGRPLFKTRLIRLFTEVTQREETSAQLPDVEEVSTADVDFSGTRGLLVEDNGLNAEIAAEILGMTGMTVEFARDGKEAVDKIAASADGYYDVIFMDIQMPFMNGYEATKAIRAMEREYTKNLPIFAMSANAFAEDVAASRASGMNGHISKPVDYDRLAQLLSRWLKK